MDKVASNHSDLHQKEDRVGEKVSNYWILSMFMIKDMTN